MSEVSDWNSVMLRMAEDYVVVVQPYKNNSNFGVVYLYDKNNNYSVEILHNPATNNIKPARCAAISPNNVIVVASTTSQLYIYTRVDGVWSIKQEFELNSVWNEVGHSSYVFPQASGVDIDVNNTIVSMDNKYVFVFMDDGNNTWSLSYHVYSDTFTGSNKIAIYDNTFIYSDTYGDFNLSDNVEYPGIVHVYKYLNGSWTKLQTLYDNDAPQDFQLTGAEIKIHKKYYSKSLYQDYYTDDIQDGRVFIFKSPDNGVTWGSVPTTVLNKLQLPDYVIWLMLLFNQGYVCMTMFLWLGPIIV